MSPEKSCREAGRNAYKETLQKLFVLKRFGVKLDLKGPARALRLLGNPQLAYPSVHIGGTNGKGSTCAMTADILQKNGLRVGLFTSPHLNRFTERIKINSKEIEEQEVADLFEEVSRLDPDLTFFERTALIAFTYFCRKSVDIAVVEVGLGGRLDVTNLVQPVVTGILQIAHDHTAYLGREISRIAWEKAGILRPGIPAAIAPGESTEAKTVLKRMAAARSTPAYFWGEEFHMISENDEGPWTYTGPGGPLVVKSLGLKGSHQVQNAATALALTGLLEGRLKASRKARIEGLADVKWPGRGEIILLEDNKKVLLDGCHNPAAAQALTELLDNMEYENLHVVIGAMSDKDLEATLVPLAKRARNAFVTRVSYYRSCSVEELIRRIASAAPDTRVSAIVPVDKAVMKALAISAKEDLVVIAGSFFLVGEAKRILANDNSDPFQVTDPVHPPEIPRSKSSKPVEQ